MYTASSSYQPRSPTRRNDISSSHPVGVDVHPTAQQSTCQVGDDQSPTLIWRLGVPGTQPRPLTNKTCHSHGHGSSPQSQPEVRAAWAREQWQRHRRARRRRDRAASRIRAGQGNGALIDGVAQLLRCRRALAGSARDGGWAWPGYSWSDALSTSQSARFTPLISTSGMRRPCHHTTRLCHCEPSPPGTSRPRGRQRCSMCGLPGEFRPPSCGTSRRRWLRRR